MVMPLMPEWVVVFRRWRPKRLTRRQRGECARSLIWLPIVNLERGIVSITTHRSANKRSLLTGALATAAAETRVRKMVKRILVLGS